MAKVERVALGEVVEIERVIVEPSEICSDQHCVSLEDLDPDTGEVQLARQREQPKSSKFRFTRDHVLYGKLRPYLRKVARPVMPGVCSTDILPLLPGSRLDRNYLFHFMRSPEFTSKATQAAVGVNLPRLSPSVLSTFAIPLPPLCEQRRIAEILDRADALRAKRRAALARLDTLTQSIFLDMFGDPTLNTRNWPWKKLADLGSLDRGVSKHRPRNAPELLGGPYPFVQTGDVANCDGYVRTHSATYSEQGLRQSRMWPAGTLCITIAANIAKTGILTFDACFPDSVVGFRAEERATVEFVRVWLSFLQASLERSAPESAQKNINLEILRALDVPAPDVELRREFARKLDATERCKDSWRQAIDECDALFASLQHRAFRGEL